jgi:hypothetical protein
MAYKIEPACAFGVYLKFDWLTPEHISWKIMGDLFTNREPSIETWRLCQFQNPNENHAPGKEFFFFAAHTYCYSIGFSYLYCILGG